MARHELADHVSTILQRAYPGEVEKEDLEQQTGLGSKDLRAALDSLSEEGELDPIAEHYRWRDPTGQDNPPPDAEPDDAAESPAEDPAPLRTGFDDASAQNRLVLGVAINFPNSDDDEVAVEAARTITERVQNVLNTGPMADLGAIVTIRRLEVYDKPRVLFDAEGGAEQSEV